MINIESQINKQTLGEAVITRIKDYIIDNGLAAGDRLPTEQEMADSFGVSRLSVREATKTLNYLGIIDSAPRRGLTVGKFDLERLNEILGFHFALNNYPREQLLQTRLVVELGVLGYSSEAIARDDKLYAKLSDICGKIEQSSDIDSYIEWDINFHTVLVQASGIDPLIMFNDLLQMFFKKFRIEIADIRQSWAMGRDFHREILESLRSGDVAKAQELLRSHLGCYGKS